MTFEGYRKYQVDVCLRYRVIVAAPPDTENLKAMMGPYANIDLNDWTTPEVMVEQVTDLLASTTAIVQETQRVPDLQHYSDTEDTWGVVHPELPGRILDPDLYSAAHQIELKEALSATAGEVRRNLLQLELPGVQ